MPARRYTQFGRDIARARDLIALGQSIGGMTRGRVDASDLYRAALVQAVAALDSYVHGVVLDRAVDILVGRSTGLVRTNRIGLHFTAVSDLLAATSPTELELAARRHVAQRLTLETFQKPEDVAKALALVNVPRIWSTAFSDARAATAGLGAVVNRRNRIVHSCDVDPLASDSITPLADGDALAALATIEVTVAGIDQECGA